MITFYFIFIVVIYHIAKQAITKLLFSSGTQNRGPQIQNQILPRPSDDNARNVQEDILSSDSATLDNYDNKTKPNNNGVSTLSLQFFHY